MQQKLQQAIELYQRGSHQQAERVCAGILEQFPRQPDALHILGMIETDRGALERARQLFQKGLKKAPGHLHLHNSIGLVEEKLGNISRAEAHFRLALKIDPAYIHARYNLASLFDSERDYAKAKRLYHAVIKQQPQFVEALANLSSILETEHQLAEARLYADRALQINPDHYIARLTLANIANREGAFDEVIRLLAPLMQAGKLSPVNYAVAGGKCAHAFEKLGDYQTAFSFYQEVNRVLYEVFQPQMQNLESLYAPVSISNIDRAIPGFDFTCGPGEETTPVFLIGFPRSGTTLLDQILSSHSKISVLEEKENLVDAYTRFPPTQIGLEELNNANEAELRKLRRKYWSNIIREAGVSNTNPVIVDKLPLNAVALLHIFKLFPTAKIIVVLRDPRDCVFSCYQQRFGMSQAMFQFLDLDTAVAYYDQVMKIIVKIRDAGALPMHFVRYESIIGDLRGETKTLVDFLGLEWEQEMLDYQATAKSRIISTPSAHQVIQPLYRSSIGKWKHYQQWIGSSFEPLRGWVDEWGYS